MKVNNLVFLLLIYISGITFADDEIIKIIPIKANSGTGASPQFALPTLDNEYLPLFAVRPQYPRRAQERGTEGYVVVSFTITKKGTIENADVIEGKCGNMDNSEFGMRSCSIFNSSALRAASKLKYKPIVIDGNPVKKDNILYRFQYLIAE
jgi:protein TonB